MSDETEIINDTEDFNDMVNDLRQETDRMNVASYEDETDVSGEDEYLVQETPDENSAAEYEDDAGGTEQPPEAETDGETGWDSDEMQFEALDGTEPESTEDTLQYPDYKEYGTGREPAPFIPPEPQETPLKIADAGEGPDDYSAVRWEINRAIGENIPLHRYEGYTAPQLRQIRLAFREGEKNCVRLLTRKKFNYLQMELIRKGYEEGLPVSIYAEPEYDANQMWEIMEGLRYEIDVRPYADPQFTAEQMEVLRESIMEGVDPAAFADPALNPEQMQYRKRHSSKRIAPLTERLKRAYSILRGPQKKKTNKEKPDY